MSYSFLESSEQEWLPTIDIIWEISRQLGYRKVADIDEFWQQVDNFGGFEEDASAADKMAQLGRHFYRQLGYSDAPESCWRAYCSQMGNIVSDIFIPQFILLGSVGLGFRKLCFSWPTIVI